MNTFPTRAEIAAMRNRGMAKPLTEPKAGERPVAVFNSQWTVTPPLNEEVVFRPRSSESVVAKITKCPKCDRKLGRGKAKHLAFCKGK